MKKTIPFLTISIAFTMLISFSLSIQAATFYVDPINGSMSNNGSYNAPWRTLQEVFDNNLIETQEGVTKPYNGTGPLKIKNQGAPVKAGDVILLRNGNHGSITLYSGYNADYITIKAESGQEPIVSNIQFFGVRKWKIEDVIFRPTAPPVNSGSAMFKAQSHSYHGPTSDIQILNCDLASTVNSSNWTSYDWNNKAWTAIKIKGDQVLVEDNYCKNVDWGIEIIGNLAEVRNNVVENFAGDGLIGNGNDLLFEYNLIKNCYDVNDNHDDGFQSYVSNNEIWNNVILRGNVIINYEDPNQPFKGVLQGIGCFDGFYNNWTVENNVVVVDNYHGISLYGATNCKIINNTVVSVANPTIGPTTIRLFNQKQSAGGGISTNCIIRNNIVAGVITESPQTLSNNLLITNAGYNTIFVDYNNWDLRLKAASPAIDAGSSNNAPSLDQDQNNRPYGNAYDIGAYEYGSNTNPPSSSNCNLLKNGDFSLGQEDWSYWVNSATNTTLNVNNGEAHAQINNGGTKNWHIQLTQGEIPLETGKQYVLEITARADANRSIAAIIHKPVSPWTTYANTSFNLTTQYQTFTHTFTMNPATDNDSRLKFYLGLNNSDVYVKEVVVREANCNQNPPPTNICNILENSDFSSGQDDWFYWVNNAATSSLNVSNGLVHAQIVNGGTKDWHIQLAQGDILLENGKQYKLKIKARAVSNRSISAKIHQPVSPWALYANTTFNLTTQTQTYTHTFTMNQVTDNTSLLKIYLGDSNTDVYIEDVQIEAMSCNSGKHSSLSEREHINPTGNQIEKMSIYPNPVQGTLNIQVILTDDEEKATLRLFDSYGKEVKRKQITLFGQNIVNAMDFDVTNLPTGIYMFQLKIGAITQNKKIVVQN